jgi:O-succinylhomoserine sulfhydrylase
MITGKEEEWGEETIALHTGYSPVPLDMTQFRSFVPPIIQSSAYPFESVAHAARVIQHKEPGYGYGRDSNPTADILSKRLAALEGGERGLVTPTGQHAVFALLYNLAKVGDEIVTSHMVFGGAHVLFARLAPDRMGITSRFVENPADLDEWDRLITPKTRFVWAETPSNPTLFVTDIAGLAEVAHSHNVPLIVDNTLATACLQRPLALGADIVTLSLTKNTVGNGSTVGGAVIGSGELIEGLLRDTMMYIGGTMSPFDAWITLMSLESLPLRIAKHCSNAEEIVAFLAHHPKITGVNYPSLPHHPQHELARHQMPNGYGALLSFVVEGGLDGATKVMEACQMITIIPSFGTSRTIAMHPASHSHFGMTPEEREAAGIYDGLIRLSIGLEASKDIIADLEQALDNL